MTRLSELTARLKAEGRKPIVPFLTAGFPDRETFRGVMEAAAGAGCPLVEIGFPFSDPVADGPVIQAASLRALAQGVSLTESLRLAAEVGRDFGLTVVLMGYLNPILRMGPDGFARACGEAGVAGVIVPDLPLEEAAPLRGVLREVGVELVDLVAPTTGEDRMAGHREAAGGFLYLVSTTGVTGAGPGAGDDLETYVARVRAASTLPLYVGFGIAEPAQAARVARCADGAVVGSALIRAIDAAGSGPAAVAAARRFLTEMTAAMADPAAVPAPGRNES
jgi:tryptophan synthase alpha chain